MQSKLARATKSLVGATALLCVAGAPMVALADSTPPSTLSMRTASQRAQTALRPITWPSSMKPVFAWFFNQPVSPDQPAPPAPPTPPAPPAPPVVEAAPPEPPPLAAEPPAAEPMPTDEELAAAAVAEAEALEQEGETIQITGSAIERTETTTAAPVTVLDKAELEAAGMASIGDILQDLPSQSNAINTQANNGGDGSTRVDIRGLGSQRTLVLLNGRRHVPGGTGADASVDLSSIPLAVIERIEVLKDGASAVYGSDAVAGVVNIITRDKVDGAEATLYTATTQRGGGTVYDASFVAGQSSPKGHVVFAAGFYDQGDVFAGERDFSNVQRDTDWDCLGVKDDPAAWVDSPDPAGPQLAYCADYDVNGNSRLTESELESKSGSSATPQGTVVDYRSVCDPKIPPEDQPDCVPSEADFFCPSGVCFNDPVDGWRDLDGGGIFDEDPAKRTGDLYNFQPDNYLLTPQRRYNIWSSGNYKLHDNARAFFEASYVNRKSDQQLAPEPLFTVTEGIVTSVDSIYNPFGADVYDVRKRMVETGPRKTAQNVDTFRLVTGVEGNLPEDVLKGWKWEFSYNFGRTEASNINEGNLVRPNVAEALGPSFLDADGVPTCGTPGAPSTTGCVPLDVFGGVGSITPEMIDFITYTGVAKGFNKQHTLLAMANGPVAKLPNNGDIVVAVGADYRREAGGFQPDPLTATGNTTGNKVEPTIGDYDVVEGFGEVSIVPVAAQDWAKWLEINLAARAVNYSTFGNNFSYKTGLLYKAPMGLAVRGTFSTAFRAPAVAELYSGQFDDFPNVTDPCSADNGQLDNPIVAANCAADGASDADVREQMPARTGGNPDLDPETANVFTAGVVYEPPMVEGLAVTLDYFSIAIDNAIQRAGANILLANCYGSTERQDCDKIIRGGGGLITSIIDTQTNIGETETRGIDAGVSYGYEVAGAGKLRHELEGTRLLRYNNTIGEIKTIGRGVYDLGVFPDYKANFSTTWGMPDLGLGAGFNVRYIHSFTECNGDDCTKIKDPVTGDRDFANSNREVGANVTADLYASYEVKSPAGRTLLSAGVNNLLDQDPPTIYNGFLATSDSNTYDYLGRYFYLRMTQQF